MTDNIPVWTPSTIWAMDAIHMADMARKAEVFASTIASLSARSQIASGVEVNNGVAIIRIRGVMDKMPSYFLDFFGGTSSVVTRRQVEMAAADEKVKAIMLAIDSPGGSVDGLAELGDAVHAARQSKRVVAQVDGRAASAAYYVASQSERIVMHRMDRVGSIGTRMMLYDFSKMFADAGIRPVPIDTDEYKSAGAMGTEITEAQEAYFQRMIDEYQADFVKMVRRGRGLDKSAMEKAADGRVWGFEDARGLGLVDGVATFEETLARLQRGNGTPRRTRAALAIARVT